MRKVLLIALLASPLWGQQLGANLPSSAVQQVCDPTAAGLPPGLGAWTETYTLGSGPYADTIAGLTAAGAAWAADGNLASWWHVLVPNGQAAMLHGSTFPSNNALWTLPSKPGATGCLVIDPVDYASLPLVTVPWTGAGTGTICTDTLDPKTRSPGCPNDIAKLWTIRMDSCPSDCGYHDIYASGPVGDTYGNPQTTHVLIRGMEATEAPGIAQSAKGAQGAELVKYDGGPDTMGLEYSYIHGWDPGDPGQPSAAATSSITSVSSDGTTSTYVTPNTSTLVLGDLISITGVSNSAFNCTACVVVSVNNASTNFTVVNNVSSGATGTGGTATQINAGACAAWTNQATVQTQANVPTTGKTLVTRWTSATLATDKTYGSYFGMTFAAGSTVYINGTAQTIYDDGTYAEGLQNGTQNVSFVINGTSLGTCLQSTPCSYPLAQSNPPSKNSSGQYIFTYGVGTPVAGCGDDAVSGIGASATNSWFLYNYTEKIHWWASESHAMDYGFAPGPLKIAHNHLEGGACSLFSGGAAEDIKGLQVNNGEIRDNFIGHDPNWRFLTGGAGNSPGPPFGAGPILTCSPNSFCAEMDVAPFLWGMKNDLEMKLGEPMLVDGNYLAWLWADAQSGYIWVSNPRTSSGGTDAGVIDQTTGLPLTSIGNITFTNNIVAYSPQGMELGTESLGPGDGGGKSLFEDYLTLANNLWIIGDPNQYNTPGQNLVDWGGFGSNRYACTMSSTGTAGGNVVTGNCGATYPGILLASCSVNGIGCITQASSVCSADGCGIVSNAISPTEVYVTGTCNGSSTSCTVHVHLGGRQDPAIGQNNYVTLGVVISGFTGSSGTLTFTTTNNAFVASGSSITLSGFTSPNTGLNGQTVTVLSAGLTSTTFEATVTGSGYSTGAGGGTYNSTNPWTGTFAITGVDVGDNATDSKPAPECTQPTSGPVAYSQPQNCYRADGSFGDEFLYTDSSLNFSTPCEMKTVNCGNVALSNYNVAMPSLAFKMHNISVGGGINLSNCSGGTYPNYYNVGAASFFPAISPTNPAGLTFTFVDTNSGGPSGSDTSGSICDLADDVGHPYGSLFIQNTVLTTNGVNVESGNSTRQQYNNTMSHNTFAGPPGLPNSVFGFTCGSFSQEGNVAWPCWDGLLNEADNLIVNQSGGPAPATLSYYSNTYINSALTNNGTTCNPPLTNCSPGSGSGSGAAYMNWTGSLWNSSATLLPCVYDGSNPLNCPLDMPPFSTNFSLANLVPLGGSSYSSQQAQVANILAAEIQTQYGCQSTAYYTCPSSGTFYPDAPSGAGYYTLTVTPTVGGSVSDSGGYIVGCTSTGGTCSSSAVPSGTSDTLTETPSGGYVFTTWGGACSGASSTCGLTITANTSVTATWTPSVQPPTGLIIQANQGFMQSNNGFVQ